MKLKTFALVEVALVTLKALKPFLYLTTTPIDNQVVDAFILSLENVKTSLSEQRESVAQ